MSGPVIATIVAANYLPWARVLRDSIRRVLPDVPFRILLAAPESECQRAENMGLDLVRLAQLRIPVLEDMLHRYQRLPLVVAVKPALIRFLLEQGHETVMHLDADILVTGDLQPLLTEVAGHALSVTPHRLSPSPKMERTLLRAGIYNAGFVGVSNHPAARRFLEWWERRLQTHCLWDAEGGLNGDQRWLDLAVGFVEDWHIICDPGCNVAYWNLDERPVTRQGSEYRVADGPLRFFHFSGFNPGAPDVVSRFGPKRTVSELGPLADLFREYRGRLYDAGWAEAEKSMWPWGPPLGVLDRLKRWLRLTSVRV